MSQFQLHPASPPPRATAGHLPVLSVPGVGHLPGAIPELLTRSQFYWEKKQIGLSGKDRKKLQRVVKAFS